MNDPYLPNLLMFSVTLIKTLDLQLFDPSYDFWQIFNIIYLQGE